MKVISQFALLCFTYLSLAAVVSSNEIEDKLSELQAQFEELRSDLAGEQETFQKRYVSELEKLEAEAKTAGNLKLVLAIREEVEDFPTRKVPPTPSEFPGLARLQKIYTDETARILNNQKEKTANLFRSYLKQLNDLQTELTKAGKIDDAVKVLAEIENLKKAWPSVSIAPPTPKNPRNPTQPRLYQPGLVVAEYPRLETQKGSEGFVSYQELIKLDPRPEKRHTKSLKAW